MVFLNSSLYFVGLFLLGMCVFPFCFFLSLILTHLSTFLGYIQRLRQAAEQAVKDRDKQIADLFKVDAAGLHAEVERLKTENAAAFTGRRCTRARDDIALKTCDKGGILKANGKQYKTVILYTGGRKNSGIADGI